MNYTLLLVDDEPANLRMLERLFRDEFNVLTAASGSEGLEMLRRHDVALIISDQRMPGMTGIEFLKEAAQLRRQTVRIVLTGYTDVSDLVEAINSGVIYKYLTKPWVNSDLRQTVKRAIEHFETTKNSHLLTLQNARLENRMRATLQGFVNVVREMIAQRYPDVSDHCRRTSNYAALIGERFDLMPHDIEELVFAALLHELPNLGMPDGTTPGAVSWMPEQNRVLRNSYESGLGLIASIPDLQDVAMTIRYQHERFDGTGFFDGLDGDKIPLNSRILAVASAFDEIHSGRNPELMCTDEEAADWLRERSGTEFDPEVVEKCLSTQLFETDDFPGSIRSIERHETTARV